MILKIGTYGDFEDIQRLCELYSKETLGVVERYPDIKRG